VLFKLKRYEEAEEAQERLAQLREEGYGDDDDDYIDLMIFPKDFFESSSKGNPDM
jgi:hypothetical protein